MAQFVRSLVAGNAPYDKYAAGDVTALSHQQKRGLAIFEGKGRCIGCHNGANFTDNKVHNTGSADVGTFTSPNPGADLGRFDINKRKSGFGAFKTPTLRDLYKNNSFFGHAGQQTTIEAVVANYKNGGNYQAEVDLHILPIDLSAQEELDLIEFIMNGLKSATHPYSSVVDPWDLQGAGTRQ